MKYKVTAFFIANVEVLDSTPRSEVLQVAKKKAELCLDKNHGIELITLEVLDKTEVKSA